MAHSLSPQTEQLVNAHLSTGEYATADELISDALAALDRQKAWTAELRASIQQRLASNEPGSPLDLDEFKAEARRRFAAKVTNP